MLTTIKQGIVERVAQDGASTPKMAADISIEQLRYHVEHFKKAWEEARDERDAMAKKLGDKLSSIQSQLAKAKMELLAAEAAEKKK